MISFTSTRTSERHGVPPEGGTDQTAFGHRPQEEKIMFCPICFSEYRAGFTECNDCRVALVDQLPDEPEPEFHEFMELMTARDEVHIALIKAAFDEAGLDYYLHGEYANRLIPL